MATLLGWPATLPSGWSRWAWPPARFRSAAYRSGCRRFCLAPADTVWNLPTSIFGKIVVVDGILASLAGGWLGDRLLPRMKGSYYFVSAVSMGLGVPGDDRALVQQGA